MHRESAYKVPNGKLLKLKIELDEDTISKIVLNGDFFSYPEEGIEQIEKTITGCKLSDDLLNKIKDCIRENNVELFGLDAESIITAISIALEEKKDGL